MHLDSELSSTKLTRNISAVIFFFFDTYFISLWPTAIFILLCTMYAQCQVEVVAEAYNWQLTQNCVEEFRCIYECVKGEKMFKSWETV